jgi:DNA integrity scanning protein DisA with diadenylate cyclase activity
MPVKLPPRPDFESIEAVASKSADRRTSILALIGNLVFSWSNNESLFIYLLMILLKTDQTSAAIVFATLNTTRARLDLIQRLAKMQVKDRVTAKQLTELIDRFNKYTRIRNEFNHCMYDVSSRGEITHTHSIRIVETRNKLHLGDTRPMDDARIKEMTEAIKGLKQLNRDIWTFMPQLEQHLNSSSKPVGASSVRSNSGKTEKANSQK